MISLVKKGVDHLMPTHTPTQKNLIKQVLKLLQKDENIFNLYVWILFVFQLAPHILALF